ENGQRVSPSTLGMVENRLGWGPGSCRRILAGGGPTGVAPGPGQAEHEDPELWHPPRTPRLPPHAGRGPRPLSPDCRGWATPENGSRPGGALNRRLLTLCRRFRCGLLADRVRYWRVYASANHAAMARITPAAAPATECCFISTVAGITSPARMRPAPRSRRP